MFCIKLYSLKHNSYCFDTSTFSMKTYRFGKTGEILLHLLLLNFIVFYSTAGPSATVSAGLVYSNGNIV